MSFGMKGKPMRLYLGLLLTTAIEAVVTLVALASFAAAVIYAIAQGVMIEVAVFVGFAAIITGFWALYGPLRLEPGLQGILSHFAGEPARDLSLNDAKGRALFLAVMVALGAATLIFMPLAVLLSGWIQKSVIESLNIVIMLEFFIGAPTLFFFGKQAYSRAKTYFFQGDDGPPQSPDLDNRIRASLEKDLNTLS